MNCKQIILGFYKKYLLRFLCGVVLIVVSTVLNAKLPRLLGDAIDIIENKTGGELSFVLDNVGIVIRTMIVFAVFSFVTKFIWRYLILAFNRSVELHIRHSIFTRLQQLSPEYYVKNNTGDLITRSIVDVQAIRMMIGIGIVGIIDVLTIGAVTITNMISMANLRLTLMAVIPVPFLIVLLVKIRTLIRVRYNAVQHAVSDIGARVQENITGIRVIKAFAQEDSENERFAELSRAKWKAEMRMTRAIAVIQPSATLVFGIVFSLFLFFGGRMVVDGRMTLGEFVAFNTYIGYLTDPVLRISRIVQVWQRGIVSMGRIDYMLSAKPAVNDSRADMSLDKLEHVDIVVDNLTYRYPDTDVDVLKNVSFSVSQGEVVAILGPTGCGKTTMLNLLMRLWNCPPGAIRISGRSIEEIPLHTLRSAIAYVPQDTFLFSDTILNNIIFFDSRITGQNAIDAAKAAVIHDSIVEFEKGYNTVVGERGMTLSGGQKQRISIARAIARRPQLLLLDDCLSAVDAETEHAIIANLGSYIKGSTTLLVTHRIAAAGLADKVLLMREDGGVEAFGTPAELMESSPTYRRLVELAESRPGERR